MPSSGRIASLGKYLAALSNSFGGAQVANGSATDSPLHKPSVKRRCLHILYILNDLFHHVKYHDAGASGFASLTITIHPHVLTLLSTAASFPVDQNTKHFQKLESILELWAEHAYYSAQHFETLKEVVKNAKASITINGEGKAEDDEGVPPTQGKSSGKEQPFIMPSTHGDPSTPYYDLPAGNLIPHIVPNSSTPMHPKRVKPLQFMAGPAEDALANVVKDFLRDAEAMYSGTFVDEGIEMDIDEMGQKLAKDDITGEFTAIEGYYGWSVAFCERMTRRKHGGSGEARAASRERERSGSSTPRKRRRHSSPLGDDRSRSRDRDRRRYDSPSRSRSSSSQGQPRRAAFQREEAPKLLRNFESGQDKPAAGVRPPLKYDHLAAAHLRPLTTHTPVEQIDNPFTHVMPPAPVAHAANHFVHNFPMGPNGLPVPPPPPFHQGPWPPPPPNMPYPFNGNQYPMGGFMPPPPPQGLQAGWQPTMPQYRNPAYPPPPPPPPASQGQGYYGGGGASGPGMGGSQWRQGQDPRRR